MGARIKIGPGCNALNGVTWKNIAQVVALQVFKMNKSVPVCQSYLSVHLKQSLTSKKGEIIYC